MEAETDDDIRMCCALDESQLLINEKGFRKPLAFLKIGDKDIIIGALLDYYLMVKVKAEIDQFQNGLKTLGFLEEFQLRKSNWRY